MSDTTPSNRVRDILNTAAADLTPDVVYAAIQVAERRRDRADDDIRLLNAKFVEVARAVHVVHRTDEATSCIGHPTPHGTQPVNGIDDSMDAEPLAEDDAMLRRKGVMPSERRAD